MHRIPMSVVDAHRNGDCGSDCEICEMEDAAYEWEEDQ